MLKLKFIASFLIIPFILYSQWYNITPKPSYDYNIIKTRNLNEIWVMGNNIIQFSIDDGNSWQYPLTIPNYNIIDFQFINDSLVYVYSLSPNLILKSNDLCNSFYDTITLCSYCNNKYFINEDLGFSSGQNYIYRSVNSGYSFDTVWSYSDVGCQWAYIRKMVFINDSIGFACGLKRQDILSSAIQGFILKSSNRGLSWDLVYQDTDDYCSDIITIDNLKEYSDTIYAGEESGHVYWSFDQGITWYKIPWINHFWIFREYEFINLDTGFLTCYHTINGFVDTMHVVKVMATHTSGNNWFNQYIDTITISNPLFFNYDILNSIEFLNDSIGFTVGNHTILKTNNSGGSGIWPYINNESFLEDLFNIFPNPTSSFIDCKLQIKNCNITLCIFDIFGRKVKEIKVPKGQQQLKVNVSNWYNGLYIAVFRNNKKIIAKQKFMVLR